MYANILVAVDGSEASKRAVEEGIRRLIQVNRPLTASPTLNRVLPRTRLRDKRAERMQFIWTRLEDRHGN